MDTAHPTVSVVIPARKGSGSLKDALTSIENQSYTNIIEVVVAAADDESAREARGALVVANPSGSTPAGLNIAIEATSGDIIVRCDTHSSLPAEYVDRAVATLLRTGAANVGGMQVPLGNSSWENAIAAAMRSRLGAGDARYRIGGGAGPAETVYLGVFDRRALEAVGGFDEEFLRTQDYELNHRLIESGRLVWFDPELKVDYRPRGSLRDLARQYLEYGKAKRRFNEKHPGSLRPRQLAPPILVLGLTGSLILSLFVPWTAVVIVGYAGGLVIAGLAERAPGPLRIAAALATMHVSWGWGFLRG